MRKRIRVLIADDSALMRRELRRIIESDPDMEVVAAVRNGQEAVEQTKALDPDVVALDINMPVMDGLTALQYIMMESPRPVLMVSSLTQEGALSTYEALELGAVDFVGKPGGTISKDIHLVADEILYKIHSAAGANTSRLKYGKRRKKKSPGKVSRTVSTGKDLPGKVVVIGESTGGPNTIMDILPVLPADLGAPVIVVQHMPKSFTPSFAQRLDKNCALPFREAKSGDIIENNCGYLAPGDIHMTLAPRGMGKDGNIVRLTKTPRDPLHKPSVDVTMRSVLSCYGENTIAVLLTGMGADGAEAMAEIREAGGRTIAESEETAVVFGMPKEAIRRGGAEFVLPSYEIGEKIVELVKT
ncbi:MAG: chemotaxis response regulator protein-glutamate methylesterase [Deltaproteobacteria bacterium]|nr:chemotaxis response regulator protein-glutamate methylesterase [Deltaproteobacteria bacterium]MBW2017233.1 chemotaxis response regulator protein-glutamate methylesterase [Deltaproteobacteria bacterium]MBW2130002.1 chemotaxis response regulator protein-glutamate methylesterase [Deltaproteobacteria bacterium]MBW2304426.1 chemotaxis response regulator protein-glutamate methylesterase [Deltaproteobacteria bacterium]